MNRPKKKSFQPVRSLVLGAAGVVVLFLILEAAARYYIMHIADDEQFLLYASLNQLQAKEKLSNYPQRRISPHRYLGYYPTPNFQRGKNRHNALGYRGDEITLPKPAGEFRIACLGGSTTYTTFVLDYRMSYPALLERRLHEAGLSNITVVNAGLDGWSSWETLINFAFRVLELDPDMIIVCHGVNDVYPRLVWPPDRFRGDNSGYRQPRILDVFMPPFYEYSSLIRAFLVRTHRIAPHAAIDRNVNPYVPTYYADDFREQILRGTYPSGIFREAAAEEMFAVNGVTFYERNMRNLVRLAQANGVTPVLATFAYCPLFPNHPETSTKAYITALDETNEATRRLARSLECALFDYAARFPNDPTLYVDGHHVNENGVKLKADLFADFLVESGLLPK